VGDGGGLLETVYGPLPFKKHDYVIIPKGTPYRLHADGDAGTFLVFESSSYIDLPKQFRNESGQITMDAPYCHRDFRLPTEMLRFDSAKHGNGPYPGTYEKSVGHDRTNELAVMCDTFRPLRMTGVAESIEDKDYHYTWVKRENEAIETSK